MSYGAVQESHFWFLCMVLCQNAAAWVEAWLHTVEPWVGLTISPSWDRSGVAWRGIRYGNRLTLEGKWVWHLLVPMTPGGGLQGSTKWEVFGEQVVELGAALHDCLFN